MKQSRFSLLILVLLLASVLAGCTGSGATMATSWPGIATDDNLAYVSYTSHVYGVRISDGGEAWRYPAEADNKKVFYARPALLDGQLIVGDFGGKLYSLNPQNGAQNWVFEKAKSRYVGAAQLAGDLILAPNSDNSLYALNKQGVGVWTFTADEAIWAQPLVNDGAVYVASMDHNLYALNPADGARLWSADLGAAVMYSLVMSEDGQTIYAGTLAKELVAVDAGSGQVLWRSAVNGSVWARPVLHEDTLFFGDQSGMVYALNTADGSQRWTLSLDAPVVGSGALVDDNLVFVTEAGAVQTIGLDGSKAWNQTINGKLYSSPLYAGGRLVIPVTSGEQLLVTMNPNGTQGWAFTPAK